MSIFPKLSLPLSLLILETHPPSTCRINQFILRIFPLLNLHQVSFQRPPVQIQISKT
jgi:hypothetical protein